MNAKPLQPDQNPKRLVYVGWVIALINIAVTALVLVSPIGLGDGTGMISYSIPRLLIIMPQCVLALLGMIFVALNIREQWRIALLGIAVHLLIIALTLMFYFWQARSICRLMSC